MLLAETLTNLHSFIVIVTNHCGVDVYRFDTNTDPKTGEFYLRQIIGLFMHLHSSKYNYVFVCSFSTICLDAHNNICC